jgi:transcription antitermination factor NusG
MLRTCVAATVALLLLVGVTVAEKEKAKSAQVKGKIKKVDADKGVLTVTVGKGDSTKDVDFKITDDTKLIGTNRKPLEDGLKDKSLKAGTDVTVFTDDEGKVKGVQVGGTEKFETKPPKALPRFGKIKKVDPDKGVLTVTIGVGDQAKDVEYKISDTTRIMAGAQPKELKDGLKNKLVKAGTIVTIFADEDGKVEGILIAGGKDPGPGPMKFAPTLGKIKRVDADKGVLTVTVGKGDSTKDMEFKISDNTKIMGANGKELKGGLKSDQLKAGEAVTIFSDPEGKVAGLMLGHTDGSSTTVGKPHQAQGKIKKVDAEKGVLTVTVGTKDVDYKITQATRIGFGKTELKDGLKNPHIKAGADVTVYTDDDGKVLGVLLVGDQDGGDKPKGVHEVRGTIKKVDAAKGVLVVSVGKGDGAKEQEFKLGADTRFVGADKKPLEDGIKDESLKAGTEVTLYTDGDGKVRGVILGKKGKVEDKEKDKE